ncbi:hypothetical protein NDU88_004121 [Pleurodeles waltl]|uniref:Uncharacterized protein n=1 Tax=Pleurodeles waltl TaxID=8319 RepID=A0AAV7MTN4_PLEWA|nr:hypothetical protein NDU88_004121 [Pleurodeles waltl]
MDDGTEAAVSETLRRELTAREARTTTGTSRKTGFSQKDRNALLNGLLQLLTEFDRSAEHLFFALRTLVLSHKESP